MSDQWDDAEELSEEEIDFLDPPLPEEPNYRPVRDRADRTRFVSEAGEKIAKRDVEASLKGGVYGPKITSPEDGKEYAVGGYAHNCPLDKDVQKSIFGMLRRGNLEQTAVEAHGVSFSDWVGWKSESPAFSARVESHKSPRAAKIEQAMFTVASGEAKVRKTTTRTIHAYKNTTKEDGTEIIPLSAPILLETIEEVKEIPADMKAAKLYLGAQGREGFQEKGTTNIGVNINLVCGNETISAAEKAALDVFGGKRDVIDTESVVVEEGESSE